MAVQIVGLMGYERAGKSTAAKFLCEHGFETASFASVLKRMLEAGFGLGREALHGSEKETPHPALNGATPRHAMQSLGTEWGRKLIHDDLWVEAFKRDLQAREAAAPGGRYLVEDVRYDNEVRVIRELGGEIWVIRRPSVEPLMSWRHNTLRRLRLLPHLHTSSTGWAQIKDAERTVWNISSQQAFEEEIRSTHNVWRALRFWKQGDRPFDGDALALIGMDPFEREAALASGEGNTSGLAETPADVVPPAEKQ